MVVGGGPQLDELKEYHQKHPSASHVYFTGPKPAEEVPNYYHASDLFVSASMSETQGLTYIEGLAAGLPILVRKDDVLEDILIENVNGFSFEGHSNCH